MTRPGNPLRRRLPLVAGALVAIMAGVTLGASQAPPIGVATTNVLIDTPQSEVAAAAPRGMDSLWWRATLLGMLLGTKSEQQQMARAIGVSADDVGVSDVELATPIVLSALPVAATQSATVNAPYLVTVYTDHVLPVVSIQATAPDRAGASRLAEAAVQQLKAGVSARYTSQIQGLSVKQVSPVKVRDVVISSGHTKMIAVALVVFCLWWLGLVAGRRLTARHRRRRDAAPALAG